MSRNFSGSNEGLTNGTGLGITGYPFTFAGWFRLDGTQPNTQGLIWSMDVSGQSNNYSCWVVDPGGGYELAQEVWNGSWVENHNSADITIGTWHHFVAIYTSATSRDLVVNGDWAGRATSTTSATFASPTAFYVALDSANAQDFDGQIAHLAVWNRALLQHEVTALYGSGVGADPRRIAQGGNIHYWKLSGLTSPENDEIGGESLTLVGSPTQGTTDPPIEIVSFESRTSRDFNGTSQLATMYYNLFPSFPYTIAGWFKVDTLPGSGSYSDLFVSCNSTNGISVTGAWTIELNGDDNGDLTVFLNNNNTWDPIAPTNNNINTSTWVHCAFIVTSSTSRRFVINGDWSASATYTTNIGLLGGTGHDLNIFAALYTSGQQYLDGQLAHWAVWNSALTQTDIETLANGASPTSIARDNLNYMWKLSGSTSPETELFSYAPATLVNSPPQYSSGPYIQRSAPVFRSASGGVSSSSGTSLTMSEPNNAKSGDILLFAGITDQGSGNEWSSGPTGWTELNSPGWEGDESVGGKMDHTKLFWIRRGSSAPNLTMTTTVSGQYKEAIIVCYAGCEPTESPFDGTLQSYYQFISSGQSNAPDPPPITSTIPNTIAVALGMTWQGWSTGGSAPSSGITNIKIVTDDFNRANGSVGVNYSAHQFSMPQITSNQIIGPSNNGYDALYVNKLFNSNQYVKFTLTATGSNMYHWGILRGSGAVSTSNCYRVSGGNIDEVYISRTINNSDVDLVSTTLPGSDVWTAGDVCEGRIIGSIITFFRNGIQIASYDDSTHVSGYPGFGLYNPATIDDVEFGAIITGAYQLRGTAAAADDFAFADKLIPSVGTENPGTFGGGGTLSSSQDILGITILLRGPIENVNINTFNPFFMFNI